MSKIIKLVYFTLFFSILVAVVYVSNIYKDELIQEKEKEYFTSNTEQLNRQINKLISDKKASQLMMLQQLVADHKVLQLINIKQFDSNSYKYIFQKLQLYGDIKGSRVQFISANGVSLSRSWDSVTGDNLVNIRQDVASMIKSPRIISSISIGKYNMTFKTMMPIFNSENSFIGSIELISTFDSMVEELKHFGYNSLVLVDKQYKKQITYPITKTFIGDYYVANTNADKQMLQFIKSKGAEHFISPYYSYVIDKNTAVFNYALFDEKEVFLGNILLAKDISSFRDSKIEPIKSDVQGLLVIFIIFISLGFYVLGNNYNLHLKIDRLLFFSFSIFILIYLFYFLGVYFYYHEQENSYRYSYNESVKVDFENISNKYSDIAEIMFKLEIENVKIFEILKKAQDPSKKDEAREELYEQLKDKYEQNKLYGVRQLHFHLSNNESFLRMHKPNIYGDNLTKSRPTVRWVNEHHQRIDGFEEGKIYSGFRHIFPLFYQYDSSNKFYMGSVEISFSSFSFIKNLANTDGCQGSFLVKSDIVNSTLFTSQKSNYENSIYAGWSFDKAVREKLRNLSIDADISLIGSQKYAYIEEKIDKGEVFSISDKNENYLFTFIPLKNPITNEVVAIFILQKNNAIFLNMQNSKRIAYLLGFILLLFVFMYMYKEISLKKEYKLLLRKTQRILDAQDSILLIMNKDEILEVNKKFLDFFGYASLAIFKLHDRDISEKFLDDERCFHIKNIENKRDWIEKLASIDSKDKIVSMMDKKGDVYYFSIQENKMEDNYLLELSDISDTMKEKFRFIDKAYTDSLTGAYNREYFNASNETIINSTHNGLHLGIIFCDIDLFKNVNDTYGHDVGDQVLKQIVQIMRKTIRVDDLIVRWGGEEFVIFLNIDSMDILIKIANNIREAIESEVFDNVEKITCSFGLSIYNKDEDIYEAIKRADEALYEAKRSGRNRVNFKS
ncbi:MAG: diguanylate cyclase [Thiovulaceae bacterium]|nr:diguanylate cyclase [Sulfurimonadaceae bacterium]